MWCGSASSWADLHPEGCQLVIRWRDGGRLPSRGGGLGNGFHAGVWTGTAASWLDLDPGSAEGIWTDGNQVKVVGYSDDGRAKRWTLTVVPEPRGWAPVVAAGLLGFSILRR